MLFNENKYKIDVLKRKLWDLKRNSTLLYLQLVDLLY